MSSPSAVTAITFAESQDGQLEITSLILRKGENIAKLQKIVDDTMAMLRAALDSEANGLLENHNPERPEA